MSTVIELEFPDGERIITTTNPQLSDYEDYYHKGEWYNISDPRLKVITDEDRYRDYDD